jgi:UDP-N-acetylmuramyl pentapeptide synthase
MAELGMHAAGAHREIGRLAAELGIDRLVAVGRFARETANAAREAGLSEVTELIDLEAASAVLRGLVEPGDWVLLKASRATGLERLTEVLSREG